MKILAIFILFIKISLGHAPDHTSEIMTACGRIFNLRTSE